MKTVYSNIRLLILLLIGTCSGNLVSQNTSPLIRLTMNTGNFNDETVFYFQQGGTTGFQSDFDAYKLISSMSTAPYIGSICDSILTSISGLPELKVNISVPVKAITFASGSFTFSSLQENFPTNVCVTLYDTYTGISTNILTNDYSCMLYDTTAISRFTMSFYTTSKAGTNSLSHPVCGSPDGGIISVKGEGNGPWSYEWFSGNTVVKTSLTKSTPDSLTHLIAGDYSVKITSSTGCNHYSEVFTVNAASAPTASFAADVFTTRLSSSGRVNFTSYSTGSQINTWDFGDNSGTWFGPGFSHDYAAAGSYTVTLISENKYHCRDTARQVVNVINDVTGISESNETSDIRLKTLSQGNYAFAFSFSKATNIEISLYDLKGTRLQETSLEQVTSLDHALDLNNFKSGMYLVRLVLDKTQEKIVKILN